MAFFSYADPIWRSYFDFASQALYNVSTTSSRNPDYVLDELRRALMSKGIPVKQKGWVAEPDTSLNRHLAKLEADRCIDAPMPFQSFSWTSTSDLKWDQNEPSTRLSPVMEINCARKTVRVHGHWSLSNQWPDDCLLKMPIRCDVLVWMDFFFYVYLVRISPVNHQRGEQLRWKLQYQADALSSVKWTMWWKWSTAQVQTVHIRLKRPRYRRQMGKVH